MIFFLLETKTKCANIAQVRCYSNTGYLILSRIVVFSDQSSIRALLSSSMNRTGGVLVSTFTSITVNCGFRLRTGQNQRLLNAICCFSAKHAALKSKSKDWLARNQDNVSKWSDMSTSGLLFQ